MTKFFLAPKKDAETSKVKPKALMKNKYFPKVIYMHNDSLVKEFAKKLQNKDIIELHGHGLPYIFGPANYSEDDHTAFSLALYFNNLLAERKNISLTLDLHFCNSGTIMLGEQREICFARELSQALHDLGFKNIKVCGYKGLLTGEDPLKQSAKDCSNTHSAKTRHARLEEVKDVYHGEQLIEKSIKDLNPDSYFTAQDVLESRGHQAYLRDQADFQRHILENTDASDEFENIVALSSKSPITFQLDKMRDTRPVTDIAFGTASSTSYTSGLYDLYR